MADTLRILLVEDSDDDAELILRQFKRVGANVAWQRVQTEADYLAALDTAPDVIISDYFMPQFSGFKAAELLRQRELDIPFILVSGTIGEEAAVEAMRRGASDYLLKNRLTRLPDAVERVVEQKRLHDEHLAERRKLEAEVALRERRLNAFFTRAAAGLVLLDQEFRYIQINGTLAEINGLPPEEHIGKTVRQVLPKLASSIEPVMQKVLDSGQPVIELEVSGETPSQPGVTRHWIQSFFPVPGISGSAEGIGSIVVEITERKRAEAALRENEERFRQLAENIQEVFWMTDVAKSQMIYVSPGYEKIWGQPVNALYVSPQSWLRAIHLDDRERVAAAVAHQTTGKYDEEYRILRPEGTIRWIRDRAFPVRDAGGAVYRLAGIAEDITERRELEHQFRQVQKMEAIGQLAGGVAHDFNNLLTIIRSATELVLMDEQQLGEHARENLNMVIATTERAANLTRQLLTFSCKQVMQPRPLQLNDVIGEFLKMLRRIIGEDIRLVTQLTRELPLIGADRSMMEQVIMNLVVNARDAMPEGGELSISTLVEELVTPIKSHNPDAHAGRYVCLVVADRGSGISSGVMPHIFEPFFTTKEGRGTGLGLATVYGIVRQHRGWVDVASEPGQGATFRVYFPAMASGAGFAPLPPVTGSRGGSETILLVEDDAMVRGLTRNVLQRSGYTVLEAGSGNIALEIWQRESPRINLVLTDMVMPDGLSGRQLADKMRGDRPDLKVVYASGYSPEILGKDFVMPAGSRFVRKPFDSAKLLVAIRECLDGDANHSLA